MIQSSVDTAHLVVAAILDAENYVPSRIREQPGPVEGIWAEFVHR